MCPEENAVLPQPAVQQIDSFGGNSQLRSECIQRQEREGRANFPSLQVEIVLREVEKVLGRERERARREGRSNSLQWHPKSLSIAAARREERRPHPLLSVLTRLQDIESNSGEYTFIQPKPRPTRPKEVNFSKLSCKILRSSSD